MADRGQDDGKCQHDLYEQPNCEVSSMIKSIIIFYSIMVC